MNPTKRLTAAYSTRILIIGLDWVVSILAFISAVFIHYNFNLDVEQITFDRMAPTIGLITVLELAAFKWFRTYSGILRFTGEQDIKRTFFANTVVFFLLCLFVLSGVFPFFTTQLPVLIVYYLIQLLLSIGYRVIMRIAYTSVNKVHLKPENTVIIGAGQLGMITKKSIDHDDRSVYNVVAYFDDDIALDRKLIEGIRIYQPDTAFTDIIAKYKIKKAIIAVKNISRERKKEFAEMCIQNEVTPMEVPSVDKWFNGEFQADQIKNIRVEDLLNRPPIVLDKENISREIKGKTILITGAAGSIGSEICRQIVNYAPASLIILDQAESPLVELELSLKEASTEIPNLSAVIADVSDLQRLEEVFAKYQPNIVFHAAAYKHVPMMEDHPEEAIRVNIKGTKNAADLSVKYQVGKFVMISTDKAVNPTNVMGASKRIAEIYTQALDRDKTRNPNTNFITTRFGNVLGSNGSVVPRFRQQIANGGPITVTHPDITRFFMTIPEACQLVLEAGCMGKGGEIFLFDMGKPVKILDLAKNMIKLHGLKEGEDIEIKFSGLRPGEKLYEELLASAENTSPTHNPSIMIAHVRPKAYQEVESEVSKLTQMITKNDEMQIVKQMKSIVPEFISNSSRFECLDENREKATV